MAIYRFRVSFEDHEDIYREIEIKSTQSFEDFHNAIQQAIEFDNTHPASFYSSDDYWRKGEEITLRESDDKEDSKKKSKKIMSKCKLATSIEDPHQKFVYVSDFSVLWTFNIELVKIIPDDPKATYPRCVKSAGIAKKQYKTNAVPPLVVEDEEEGPEPAVEKIFQSEEGYDGNEEEEDALLDGAEAESEEESPGAEFGSEEHSEEL